MKNLYVCNEDRFLTFFLNFYIFMAAKTNRGSINLSQIHKKKSGIDKTQECYVLSRLGKQNSGVDIFIWLI